MGHSMAGEGHLLGVNGAQYGWWGSPVRGEWGAVWLEGDTC